MATTALTSGALQTVAARQHVTVVAGAQDIGLEASDSALGNHFTSSGKDLLIVHNTDAGAQTVTVECAADSTGRDGSVSAYSLAAGDIAYIGILNTDAFKQTDGTVVIGTSDDNVHLAVLRLP